MHKPMALLVILGAAALAGCLGGGDEDDANGIMDEGYHRSAVEGFRDVAGNLTPAFAAPLLIDDVRAGGEPVIAILPSGTILISAHPGWTHYHPSDDPTHVGLEILTPANVQSYLWRSTDGGMSWDHVDLAADLANLPRSTGLGVSDPEFTVMEDGTVCMTDLIALAESSVSCSTDDGQTWLPGNSLASAGVNDRQWLASTGEELYFTAAYFASTTGPPDHHIRASTDRGMTWEDRGDVPCSQDLISNPHTGHLVVGCTAGVAVSEDGGRTWSEPLRADGDFGGSRIMAEPAIDSAGNVWVVAVQGEDAVFALGSPDEGATWPWRIDITPHFAAYANGLRNAHNGSLSGNGTFIWPWISAGSDGRLAVTWIGSYDGADSSEQSGPWYIFTAFVLEATSARPVVHVATLTPEPIHVAPICQSGTTCQVDSLQGDPSGDRRLGDFFETTIDADGYLHATWSNTAARPDDVISHPEYVRQTGGIRLIADEDLGEWVPTQG